MKKESTLMIPDERIMNKIYLIRGQKVMLDFDIAELYGVETKQLKRAVRRNIQRFPTDFMLELTSSELAKWRSQFGTSNRERMGLRIPPFAFTEHGILMLSSVLNSERAILVNIQIIRIFTRLREMLLTHKDLLLKMEELEKMVTGHDEKIALLFEYLKQFMNEKDKPRQPIGFKTKKV